MLFHPPNSDDSIYISLAENIDQLLSSHPNSLILICGDFNHHHAIWLGVGTSLTCHGTSAKDFCGSLGLTQSVNFPTRISINSTPYFLDLILTNFPENICCSSSAPNGFLTTCLSKWTSLRLLSENHLSAVESGISLRLTGRVFKQSSNFEIGLPSLLSPTSIHPGNYFKETCSPSCTDLSPLIFSCPTLPPALGSLKLVARQLF